jgi:hypothetical protein
VHAGIRTLWTFQQTPDDCGVNRDATYRDLDRDFAVWMVALIVVNSPPNDFGA